MKKVLLILALLLIFSCAGTGDYLKAVGESLTETCDECNAEHSASVVNNNDCSFIDTRDGYENYEPKFRRCSAFVENCKCWTRAGNSQRDNERRTEKFQKFKNELLKVGHVMQEQARQDSIKKAKLLEQAKQDSINKAKYDSSVNEIHALISEGAEINLILNKCAEHKKKFFFVFDVRECNAIQDSITYHQGITEITALLKENKLQECAEKCEIKVKESVLSTDSLFKDLCEKQLTSKIRKLPKNKIKTVELARIYYDNPIGIMGYIFRDEGKFVWMRELVSKGVVMVQYSAGYIGECQLRPNDRILFSGTAIYLGDVHTIAFGNIPSYQLLWCGN